ncbi:MAG: phosphoribosylaminoimidazolesuccinocarboxamide synthase [candidate division WOR-3 bacterium]|nr:phosphoribosylaminoimidazolesuccinocarboxamide synthase [candidate division WOR-3 bacterium]MCX7757621.1 phosphoribosylaminoimidazolesuccinocarboxamide synthase [candidate division WOR-3 bacterium]MDW7987607.1 phosphoribosylaminoimidazolesuccinocarboxamide synthase [candidate division WOR-3 bacterium]
MLTEINIPDIPLYKRGKVRDIYDLGDNLLIIATDRISAFDIVMPDPIPDKGKVLTLLSCFWFNFTKDIVPNHLVTADCKEFPKELAPYQELLNKRAMIVRKTKPLPVECIVRGYLTGSAWDEYQKTQTVSGIKLPGNLKQAEKLPEPIFTPSTKAETGHDQNITEDTMKKIIGEELTNIIKKISIDIYKKASIYTEARGIIIADTKFEFGLIDNELILIDELLTPDSSRFWDIHEYQVGTPPPSFDKQYLRDYLQSIGWNKQPPAPRLPEEIIRKTREKYLLAYEKITGGKLD